MTRRHHREKSRPRSWDTAFARSLRCEWMIEQARPQPLEGGRPPQRLEMRVHYLGRGAISVRGLAIRRLVRGRPK